MPQGVDVTVDVDGVATIDFVDRAKRGQGLQALLDAGTPPEVIEKLTRPSLLYRVPEGYARAAGLLDEANLVEALSVPDTSSATDVSGFIPPSDPSTTELFAQTVRSGSYGNEYATGGLVAEGTGAPNIGTEVAVGESAELVAEDTGGPYVTLPVIDEPVVAPTQGYDDGEPDMDWARKAINEYALTKLTPPLDVSGEANKTDALKAIKAHKQEQ